MSRDSFLAGVLVLIWSPAWGDSIGGIPRADFNLGELRIPCVKVENLRADLDGYYDVILDRRGNSFNFELRLAEVENPASCRAIDDYAKYVDDDFVDDNPAGGAAGGNAGNGRILVTCEKRPDRAKISVNGKHLGPGQYFASITSGGNSVETSLQSAGADGEVEFDADSDPGDIAEGATPIDANFIVDLEITSASILDASGETVVSVDSVACLSK